MCVCACIGLRDFFVICLRCVLSLRIICACTCLCYYHFVLFVVGVLLLCVCARFGLRGVVRFVFALCVFVLVSGCVTLCVVRLLCVLSFRILCSCTSSWQYNVVWCVFGVLCVVCVVLVSGCVMLFVMCLSRALSLRSICSCTCLWQFKLVWCVCCLYLCSCLFRVA